MVTPAVHEVLRSTHGKTDDSVQNIYQTPSIPRTTSSPAYERMDVIYKVPSAHLLASKGPEAPGFMPSTAGPEAHKVQVIFFLYLENDYFAVFGKELVVADSQCVCPRSKSFMLLRKC